MQNFYKSTNKAPKRQLLRLLNYYNNKTKIIDNLSLNINDNDKVLIIGPSGSGKSTLIKLLDGEEIPDEESSGLG